MEGGTPGLTGLAGSPSSSRDLCLSGEQGTDSSWPSGTVSACKPHCSHQAKSSQRCGLGHQLQEEEEESVSWSQEAESPGLSLIFH